MTALTSTGRLLLAALVAATVLWASAALAQDVPGVDMERFNTLAKTVEKAVDASDTPATELETFRTQLATFREKFNEGREVNSDRIASLREQISLLGAAPAEGAAPEAVDIARKRADLDEQLAELTAPRQVADAAYTRADGLVGEIDKILRDRQAQKLLEVVESPLNPLQWPLALEALTSAVSKLVIQVTPEQAARRKADLRPKLPFILTATLAGLVLILRGRRWATSIVGRMRRAGARGLGVWKFVVSLLRIGLPLLGLWILSYAAQSTGYLGQRGDELAQAIPVLGGIMLGFRWVSEQAFAREEDDALLTLSAQDRADARFFVGGITILLIFDRLLTLILTLDDADTSMLAVVSLPFTAAICYGMYRIGRLLRRYGTETLEQEDDELTRSSSLSRLVRSLGTAAIGVAFAAPLLQAAGYYNASEFVLQPFVVTLVLLGLVLALQRFSADVYGTVTGQGLAARDALTPIFFGLLLLLALLPVLALVWGARVDDLTEIWAAFRRGFAIGSSRISPTDFLAFALIFTLGYLATRLAQGALKSSILPKTKIDKGGQNAIVSGLGYVGIFLAALAAITGAGIDLSSLAIVAGALSVGIGFGLQNIVSNFVSGIILLIERPISEGDWIEVSGGQMGYVRDISVRSTRIETFDRTDVIVPNADLISGTVTNFTRGNTLGRVLIPIGVAYGTDTKRVEKILQEIASEQPMALTNPPPAVLLLNFGADALEFEIRMFLRDINWMMAVKSDVNHAIAKRFAEEGIEIPFSQRDVWLRNPEVLQAAPSQSAAKTPEATVESSPEMQDEKPDAAKGEGDR